MHLKNIIIQWFQIIKFTISLEIEKKKSAFFSVSESSTRDHFLNIKLYYRESVHEIQLDTLQIKWSTISIHRLHIFMLYFCLSVLCPYTEYDCFPIRYPVYLVSTIVLSLFRCDYCAQRVHRLSCVDVMIYTHIIYGKLHAIFSVVHTQLYPKAIRIPIQQADTQ